MKPLILTLIISVLGLAVYAQPKRGDFLLSGSLSFARQEGQTPDNAANSITTETYLRFSPQVGIFFSKRILAGFSTQVDYYGSSYAYTLVDSQMREWKLKDQVFKLSYGFGGYVSYYYPINDKLFWTTGTNINGGTITEGDKLSSLFETDKPRQDRKRFVDCKLTTGIQYFIRPNLGLQMGITPLQVTYTYARQVPNNQPASNRDEVRTTFMSVPKGFFISINYLIISDNDNEK